MKKILVLYMLSFCSLATHAQKFITSGTIEYEVRVNVHKNMGDDEWMEQFKDKIPQFSVNYYTCVFDNNKAIYKFDHTGDKQKIPTWFTRNDEDNFWYTDYSKAQFVNRKAVDDNYIISGDLKNINWKLSPNDNTIIAGFNCRKASAILFDSVYIFAYYTDEIAVSGGPMSLHGLPGMILGLTIPRLYSSWVATYVKLDATTSAIAPPNKGKKKTEEDIKQALMDLSKSWGKDGSKYLNPMIWRTLL